VIAQFLLLNRDSLSPSILSSEITDLRDLSRQRESLVDQMSATKSEIKRLLTMTFPELEQIGGVFTKSMLRMLVKLFFQLTGQATEYMLLWMAGRRY
jgi:hypothetical protein